MTTVTAADGEQADLNIDSIAIIADDPATGLADIFGVAHGALQITETASAVVARLGLDPKLARLTRPDGSPVWISGKAASMVRGPAGGVATVVTGALTQSVAEDIATTVAALNARGGNF